VTGTERIGTNRGEHGARDHGPDHGHGPGHGNGHGHGHGQGQAGDWAEAGDRLEREAELAVEVVDGAALWFAELAGEHRIGRVLDLGSGPGVGACALASAFPEAAVVAVDGSAELLERAAARAARRQVADRVSTLRADLPGGLDDVGPADLIWASRVVHHFPDQAAAVAAIAGRLVPGGLLAIAEGGLAARTLPRDIGIGRPGLEARLEAAQQDWFAEMRAEQPGATPVVEDWAGLLAAAGLEPCSRSFLVDRPAPPSAEVRELVVRQWTDTAQRAESFLDEQDRATIARLLDPDDPAGLSHRRDVFLLSATTVHVGRAPVSSAG
jgi:SAM-dependent methyltransferase